MAMVNFKKGLRANLPATYTAGTFYVTTDERAIYLDVSDSARIRIGDFQEFANIEALTANPNPSTTALYYVTDINCLAKWNGSEYIQINRDTGMTSVEVVGEGNAVTAAVYSADGRKLTLTKGATYMTAADVDGKISTAVGALGNDAEGNAYANVKAYVDAKTAGIATDAALGELQEQVEANKQDIATVKGDYLKDSDKTELNGLIETAQAAAEAADAKAVAAQSKADEAYALAGEKTTMAEVEAKNYATKDEAQGYANAKDEAIAAAKKAGDDAQDAVDALAERVEVVEGDVATIKGDYLKGSDKTELQGNIDLKADKSVVDGIVADYLKAEDKEELEGKITAEVGAREAADEALDARLVEVEAFFKLAEGEQLNDALDTLVEIQGYITSEGAAADQMVLDIAANKAAHEANAAAIAKEVKDREDADSALIERIEVVEGKAHEHENEDVLAGITAAKVEAWEAAEQNAKEHANGLNTEMDNRVKVLEAIDHEAYKDYADQAELDAVASAKEYTDALANGQVKTNTEAIATKAAQADLEAAVERVGVSEGKISALETASATHALKTDVEGVQGALNEYKESNNTAVGLKANAADVYAKTETFTKEEVNAAIADALTAANTWGEF